MKKILKVVAASTIAVALFASCNSTKVEGNDSSTKTEKKSDKKSEKKSVSDQVLDGLDNSMIEFIKKNYVESGKSFLETQQIMEQRSADMTVGKFIQAAVAGENSVTYSGTVYERILAQAMRLTDALKTDAEAKGVIKEFIDKYSDELKAQSQQDIERAKASEALLQSDEFKQSTDVLKNKGCPIDVATVLTEKPKKTDRVFTISDSKYIYYVGALAYAMDESDDNAKEHAAQIAVKGNVSINLDNNLHIVALDGLIGKREEGHCSLTLGKVDELELGIKPVFPVFNKTAYNGVTKVTISDGQSSECTLIEDFDDGVKIDVDSKASGAYSRSVFRSIVKKSGAIVAGSAAVDAANEQKAKATNPMAQKAAELAYKKAFDKLVESINEIDSLEKADIRQAQKFPRVASGTSFKVAPGKYTVTVEYSNGKKDIQDVEVFANKPALVISESIEG